MKKIGIIFTALLLFCIFGVNNSTASEGKTKTEKITINGVKGKACLSSIKSEVKKVEGVKKISFSKTNFKNNSTIMNVTFSGESLELIKNAITSKGFKLEEENCDETDCSQCPNSH